MTAHPIHLVLLAALTAAAIGPVVAENPALCSGKASAIRITEALDGASFKLADGRLVRLANIIAPLSIDGDKDAIERAKNLLGEIVNGKDAMLFLASDATDRYGRISAQSVSIEGRWLEAEMLARGLARVVPAANDKCTKALLQFEDKARASRAGLWAEPRFQIFDAEGVEALLAAEGRFVVVEGVVRRVGEARGRIFLDFGRRFTEDFTIIVPDQLRKSLTALGSDPKSWRGQRIRVRGVLFSWGGPAIELNLASAIELLDREIPKIE